jgi:hypothetical protein
MLIFSFTTLALRSSLWVGRHDWCLVGSAAGHVEAITGGDDAPARLASGDGVVGGGAVAVTPAAAGLVTRDVALASVGVHVVVAVLEVGVAHVLAGSRHARRLRVVGQAVGIKHRKLWHLHKVHNIMPLPLLPNEYCTHESRQ